MKAFQTPARAARRKLLTDRFTEMLTEWGSPHAGERAAQLLAAVDQLGFTLPPALEDAPGLRPDRAAEDDSPGRREFAAAREALAARRDRRPAYGGSA
jgi:hypothetical protein